MSESKEKTKLMIDDFWKHVQARGSLAGQEYPGQIDYSIASMHGTELELYDERVNEFQARYYRDKDIDAMKMCGILFIKKICDEGAKATGPNPTYWYNVQIREYAGWISDLETNSNELSGKAKDLVWNVFLGFFDRWYSGSRYIYRQRVLWKAIVDDFEMLNGFFPNEILHVNLLARFIAARIGEKMKNHEGD